MSDLATIDYQPLLAMNQAFFKAFGHSLKTALGCLLLVAVIAGCIGALFAQSLMIIIYILIGYISYIGYLAAKYKNTVWLAFANANGWPLDLATSESVLVPPSMQFGHSQKFSPIIQALLGDITSDLFTYQCTVGSGRYQHTYYFTVGRVTLPRAMPHILLLSKKTKSALQRDMAASQDLKLEGDFDEYFKLQIEQNQQIDVLTVITPDVMQTLVNYNQAEDIEIVDDNLYFVLNKDKRDLRDTQLLIRSVDELSRQIIENSNLAHPAVATLAAQTVAPSAT